MKFQIIYCSPDAVWLTLPDGSAVLQVRRDQYEFLRSTLDLPELVCPNE